ncbi:hypothetical protein LINPERPRIM_LOCUS40072 [Linum perenne]
MYTFPPSIISVKSLRFVSNGDSSPRFFIISLSFNLLEDFHLGITTFFISTYSSPPSVCDNASMGFEFEFDSLNLLTISGNPSTLCGKKMYIAKQGPSIPDSYGSSRTLNLSNFPKRKRVLYLSMKVHGESHKCTYASCQESFKVSEGYCNI